jgi:uncharacterized protein YjbI with pentapeptide repeats
MGGLSCYKSNFYEAGMVSQDLQGSTFELCDLRGANLSRSNMSSVNFMGSSLNAAVLKKAVLTGVNLAHADIDELDFSQALTTDNMIISPDQRDIVLRYFGVTVVS